MIALLDLFHELHAHPEPAGAEVRTAELVADALRGEDLKLETGVGGHGLVAVIGEGGPTVAYRADLDAVADGSDIAHLCGHDVHATVAVGLACDLARRRPPGRVVVLFQPAEETLQGAQAMIDDGVLDRYPPDEIYALHSAPLPVGTFGVFTGQPGQDHWWIPGGDADAQAAIENRATVHRPRTPERMDALFDALTRSDDPLTSFVYVQSELAADGVRAWIRTWPDERYAELRDWARRLAPDVRFPHGDPFPAMVNDPALNEAAIGSLGEVVRLTGVPPFNGEDFALFLRRTPGVMFFLGVGERNLPHTPHFDADPSAIDVGVRVMSGLVRERLRVLAD